MARALVDPALAHRRLAAARVGRLGTITGDDRPHLVPCCFALLGAEDAEAVAPGTVVTAVDAKPKSTLALRRLANVRAHPHATLLVDHYDDGDWSALWWVRVDGVARVIDDGPDRDRGVAALVAKYEQYRRTPPPGAVIAVDITAWRTWP
jgi:PPOX class probable F420-dependent enzyme